MLHKLQIGIHWAFLVCSDDGHDGRGVGYLSLHDGRNTVGILPLTHLSVDINEGVEGDDIGCTALLPHLLVRLQCQGALSAFDTHIH